jgi:peptide/nickel transport system substrate-binding protein
MRVLLICLSALCAASAASAQDRTLRVAIESRSPTYGNPYTQTLQSIFHPLYAVYDALTLLDANGEVRPALSVSHERLDDLTWQFKLRDGVTYANGEVFDAAAMKHNLDYLLSAQGQTAYVASLIPSVARVVAVDNLTLNIITSTPDAILPRRMAAVVTVAPGQWDALGPSDYAFEPVGTGPYQIADWGESDSVLDYAPFNESWRGAPVIQDFDIVIQKEGAARSQALLSEQIDVAMNVGIDEIDYLESAGFNVVTNVSPVVGALAFNNVDQNSPFTDIRVRKAFNYAINRDAIAQYIFDGIVEPVGQGSTAGVFGHNPDVPKYPYDPERARALLEDAGYGDGITMNVLVTPGPPVMSLMYQQVAQDLSVIGVTLNIQFAQGPRWVQMWFSGDWDDAGMISAAWSNVTFMDTARGFETYSCVRPDPFFCEPSVVPDIEAAAQEFDVEKRRAILQKLAMDFHELAPTLFLFPTTNNLTYSPDVVPAEIIGIRSRAETMRFKD